MSFSTKNMTFLDKFTMLIILGLVTLAIMAGISEALLFYVFYNLIGSEGDLVLFGSISTKYIFLGAVILTLLFRFTLLISNAMASKIICNRMVTIILNTFNNTDYLFKKMSDTSELLSIVVNRITSIQAHVLQSGVNGVSAGIQIIFILTVVLYLGQVNVLKLSFFILLYLFLTILIYWKIKRIGNSISEKTTDQFREIKEYINNLKYYLIRDKLHQKAKKIVEVDSSIRLLSSILMILNGSPKILLEFSIFIALFFAINDNNLNIGVKQNDLILFLVAALRLIPQLQVVYSSAMTIVSGIPSYKFAEAKLNSYAASTSSISNEFYEEFERVSISNISYTVDNTKILRDINLSFQKGEKLIILGPSGSGKTTLLEIICGLISPDGMKIELNQKRVNTLNDIGWRKNISYVDQEGSVSANTLREIFNYFGEDKEFELEVKNILSEFKLSSICNGDNFMNVDWGDGLCILSGGQRARVKICAALLTGANILILDETLANIDDDSDRIIVEKLNDQDATVIIISHKNHHHTAFKVLSDLRSLR